MTQTRRTSSIHPRKKPLPSEVRSSLGSYLDKAKKRETFYGMMFTIGEMLGSLPWPGIKTAFHQTGSGPQVHIRLSRSQFCQSAITRSQERPSINGQREMFVIWWYAECLRMSSGRRLDNYTVRYAAT